MIMAMTIIILNKRYMIIIIIMKQCEVSRTDNPFSYLWIANCVRALFCCHGIFFAQGIEKTIIRQFTREKDQSAK